MAGRPIGGLSVPGLSPQRQPLPSATLCRGSCAPASALQLHEGAATNFKLVNGCISTAGAATEAMYPNYPTPHQPPLPEHVAGVRRDARVVPGGLTRLCRDRPPSPCCSDPGAQAPHSELPALHALRGAASQTGQAPAAVRVRHGRAATTAARAGRWPSAGRRSRRGRRPCSGRGR